MARKKFANNFFKSIIIFIILAILMSAGFYFIFPDITKLKKVNPKKTSFMEYREEEWKRRDKKISIKQIWTPLSRISPYLIKAVLIAEDDKF